VGKAKRAYPRSVEEMVGTLRFAHRMDDCAVIARSGGDEAIHLSTSGEMDCFASLAMAR
jgi:hypothetical protein